jgi:hypothetical protein
MHDGVKASKVWTMDFIFHGQRIRETTGTRSKTLAVGIERKRRVMRGNCKGTSLSRKISSLRTHPVSILLGSDDDLAERVVFDGIARIISQVVGVTQFLGDLMKVRVRVDVLRVKRGATRFFCDAIHHADAVFIAGG